MCLYEYQQLPNGKLPLCKTPQQLRDPQGAAPAGGSHTLSKQSIHPNKLNSSITSENEVEHAFLFLVLGHCITRITPAHSLRVCTNDSHTSEMQLSHHCCIIDRMISTMLQKWKETRALSLLQKWTVACTRVHSGFCSPLFPSKHPSPKEFSNACHRASLVGVLCQYECLSPPAQSRRCSRSPRARTSQAHSYQAQRHHGFQHMVSVIHDHILGNMLALVRHRRSKTWFQDLTDHKRPAGMSTSHQISVAIGSCV